MIYCEFSSAGKNTVYYKNKLYDNTCTRIEDNTINWQGVKCRVDEEERWAQTNGWHFESIVAEIWDKFDVKKTKIFPNFKHDGDGFIGLFGYIEDLMLISSHKGVEIIRDIMHQKDEEINKLTKQLKALKKLNELRLKAGECQYPGIFYERETQRYFDCLLFLLSISKTTNNGRNHW